ncbi:MAG: ABC transporter transmembrane domain-containing protein [Acidimicrobiia bacterium]|nr:ABC transporter transmembrane domain-containing protein [Acidimicrobiia bacterium]
MYRRPRRQANDEPQPRLRRDDLDQLKRLFATVRPYRRHLAIAVVGVIFASSLGLVFPRIMGDLVDTAIPTADGDTGSLDRLALILVVVFLLQAGFNFVRTYYLSAMGEAVVADLRTTTYGHLLTLPVKFFDSRRTGEITSRLTSDVAVVQNTVSSALAAAMAQTITLVGGVVLLFVTSVRLSVTVLAVLPIIIIAAAVFGRRLRRVSTEFQDKVAEANAGAEESIAAVRVVKWFSAEDVERRRYADSVADSYRMALRRARLRAMFTSSVTFVAFSVLAFVVWQGGREVIRGTLSAGDLVAFLIYTLTVAGAIGTFTGLYGQLQEALGASQRIFELLDERTDLVEPADPEEPADEAGHVVFDDVGFRYSDRDVDILHRVTLEAMPGEVVAIVGPSGAGKSTLVQLIPRFFDVTAGAIVIDGVDVRRRRLSGLRSAMTAVPQETQLFSGTIAENLRVGKPDATDSELEAAAVAAHAHEFISEFPEGYETVVGERGIKLSGGQRQRVAIARALLKDPRILILDEATSSLDSEAEAIVQAALDTLMEGRTTFVIAHRLSTVRNADRILVLESGHIVQDGSHDELMTAGGLYRDLYEAQFQESPVVSRQPSEP